MNGSSDHIPLKVVLDTNVLVAAAYNPKSASRRIIEASLNGELIPYLSQALRNEYEFILERAVRRAEYLPRVRQFIDSGLLLEATAIPPAIPEDRSDEELAALALTANATLVSNDHHLLDVAGQGLRVCRPGEFSALHLRCG